MYQNVLKTLTICVIYEMVKTNFEPPNNSITNTGTILFIKFRNYKHTTNYRIDIIY